MMWNREIAGIVINLLMAASVLFLIIKRKQLGNYIEYFITALGLLTAIEIFNSVLMIINPQYNSSAVYIIGINFFVFLFFLIYFYKVLYTKRLKNFSLIIIGLFFLNYILSALMINDFFSHFSFFSYFIEIILVMASVYLVLSQTFNSDKVLSLSTYFPFWVCISLLVTYLGILPLLIISNTAAKMMNLEIFFTILFIVNVVGYLILLIGIFRARKENEVAL